MEIEVRVVDYAGKVKRLVITEGNATIKSDFLDKGAGKKLAVKLRTLAEELE